MPRRVSLGRVIATKTETREKRAPERRMGMAEAKAAGRCLCEGCGACRGKEGFPCCALTGGPLRCRWCAPNPPECKGCLMHYERLVAARRARG